MKKVLLVVAILVFVTAGFFLGKAFTGNVVKIGSSQANSLANDCTCLAHNLNLCPENFEFDKQSGYCVNSESNLITNVIHGCSKFDCSGEIWRVK